jgi:hypothetical protein
MMTITLTYRPCARTHPIGMYALIIGKNTVLVSGVHLIYATRLSILVKGFWSRYVCSFRQRGRFFFTRGSFKWV